MGREIFYCEGCGKRLTEDEFDRGRAHTVENRPYCVECKPLDAPPVPKPPPPARPATTRIPVPPSTRRQRLPSAPGAGSRTPLIIGGVAGGFVLSVLLAIALFPGGRGSAPRPKPPPDIPINDPPSKPVVDPAPGEMRKLQDFVSSTQDPDAILIRCDEARRHLKGTPFEPKFLEIEARALEARKLKTDAARLDNFLAQIRDLRGKDATFIRKDEILNMYRSAAGMAGARRAEVEQEITGYEKSFEEAAGKQAEAARSEAVKLAGQKRFPEALARIEKYSVSFRTTPHMKPLAELAEELTRKMLEWEVERKLGNWPLWRINSGKERDAPCRLESHEGKTGVYVTHPFSTETPATLEREFELPAGRRAALSFWVTHHGLGDWELRVFADRQMIHKQDVGPRWSEWRMVRLDLTPFAGRKVPIRLENAATQWIWEFGYWCDIDVKVEEDPVTPAADGALLLDASAAFIQGPSLYLKIRDGARYLGHWLSENDLAEWTVELPQAGTYAFELTWACAPDGGGDFALSAGPERLAGRSESTGGWTSYRTTNPGNLALPAGKSRIRISGKPAKEGLMNVKALRLVPVK